MIKKQTKKQTEERRIKNVYEGLLEALSTFIRLHEKEF
jgi:hypothetical protein